MLFFFISFFISGCYDITQPQTPAVTYQYIEDACVNTYQIECLKNLEGSFYEDASLVGACYQKCPIECVEVKYDLRVSASAFPTEWYAGVLNRNVRFNELINKYSFFLVNYEDNYARLKNAVARVNVYYDELTYTEIDKSPSVTVSALLGVLGGNVGLFLGKSYFFRLKHYSFTKKVFIKKNRCVYSLCY